MQCKVNFKKGHAGSSLFNDISSSIKGPQRQKSNSFSSSSIELSKFLKQKIDFSFRKSSFGTFVALILCMLHFLQKGATVPNIPCRGSHL